MQHHLTSVQPREDYQVFAQLTLMILGEQVDMDSLLTRFHALGAHRRARWMAQGIYCLATTGFHHQLVLSKREMSSLWHICLFVSTINATFWFAAPISTAAPTNDLLLLQLNERFS